MEVSTIMLVIIILSSIAIVGQMAIGITNIQNKHYEGSLTFVNPLMLAIFSTTMFYYIDNYASIFIVISIVLIYIQVLLWVDIDS